eukprot:scaffold95782_cov52-Attheya_sp.AAC.1
MATPPTTNRTNTGAGVINPYKKAPRPQQHQRKNQNTGGFSCAQFDHITSTRSAITNGSCAAFFKDWTNIVPEKQVFGPRAKQQSVD